MTVRFIFSTGARPWSAQYHRDRATASRPDLGKHRITGVMCLNLLNYFKFSERCQVALTGARPVGLMPALIRTERFPPATLSDSVC